MSGASSGIGRAMAAAYAARGMNVVMADVRAQELQVARDAVADESGAQVMAVQTDVIDADSVAAMARATMDRFGSVHVLCANAGVVSHGPVWEQSIDDWQWTLGVNLWGLIHCLRSIVPHMLQHGEDSHLVLTASAAGLISPTSSAYPASKFAVVGIGEGLAEDLKGSCIGVTLLCPGGVRTQINQSDQVRPDRFGQRGNLNPKVAASAAAMADPSRTDQVTPEYIADLVVEAILSGARYVMPMQLHFKQAIRARMQRISHELDSAPDICAG